VRPANVQELEQEEPKKEEEKKEEKKEEAKKASEEDVLAMLEGVSIEVDEGDKTLPSFTDMRGRLLLEFLATEKSYAKALETAIKKYREPLLQGAGIGESDAKVIFSNIDMLYDLSTQRVIPALTDALGGKQSSADVMLGQAILPLTKDFTCFMAYGQDYEAALARVAKLNASSKPFSSFMEKIYEESAGPAPAGTPPLAAGTGAGLAVRDLEAQLITPIQRLPRYLLLLRDIIKNTDKDSKDIPDLEKAVEGIQKSADMLNSVCMSVPETYLPATFGFRTTAGAPAKGVIFNLGIDLNSASDLLAANFGGRSDPFVTVTIIGKKEKLSSNVIRKTINPTWNQSWTLKNIDVLTEALIEVWDWERVGPPNFLGQNKIDLVSNVVILDESGAKEGTPLGEVAYNNLTLGPKPDGKDKAKIKGSVSLTLKLKAGGESPLPLLLSLPVCLKLFREANTGATKASDPIEIDKVVKMVMDALYSTGAQLHFPYVQYLAKLCSQREGTEGKVRFGVLIQEVLGDLTPICLHPKLLKILNKNQPHDPILFERLSEKAADRIPIRVAFLGAPKTGKSSIIHRFATGEFGTGGGLGEGAIDVKHKETGKVFEFTTIECDPAQMDVNSLKGCHVVVVCLSLLVQPKEGLQEASDSIGYLKTVFPFYNQIMSANTQLGMGKPHLIMLGTKSDALAGEVILPRPPFPTLTSAIRFAGGGVFESRYVESSAKDNKNVDDLFQVCAFLRLCDMK